MCSARFRRRRSVTGHRFGLLRSAPVDPTRDAAAAVGAGRNGTAAPRRWRSAPIPAAAPTSQPPVRTCSPKIPMPHTAATSGLASVIPGWEATSRPACRALPTRIRDGGRYGVGGGGWRGSEDGVQGSDGVSAGRQRQGRMARGSFRGPSSAVIGRDRPAPFTPHSVLTRPNRPITAEPVNRGDTRALTLPATSRIHPRRSTTTGIDHSSPLRRFGSDRAAYGRCRRCGRRTGRLTDPVSCRVFRTETAPQ